MSTLDSLSKIISEKNTVENKSVTDFAKNGVNEYKNNHSSPDSIFNFYDSENGYKDKDYDDAIYAASAEILAGYDEDKDGVVSKKEFANGLFNDYGEDMLEYIDSTTAEYAPAEERAFGVLRASNLVAAEVSAIDVLEENGDINSVSVEEMVTVLRYIDANGYNDINETHTMQKDNNGMGKISKSALLGFFDYCTDGGTQDDKIGQKFREGKEMDSADESSLKRIRNQIIQAMIDQASGVYAHGKKIDISKNSKYTDFQ